MYFYLTFHLYKSVPITPKPNFIGTENFWENERG